MGEIKGTTFRINEDATSKFKELASSLNLTQSEFFESLLNTYEMESAKLSLSDRSKEIDEFQGHAQRIVSIFLNSLELNQNAEARIKEQLAKKLEAKDTTIASLHNQLKISEEKKSIIERGFQVLEDEVNKLESSNQDLNEITRTKDALINEYTDKVNTLSELVAEYRSSKDKSDQLSVSLNEATEKLLDQEHIIKNLELEKVALNKQIELLEKNVEDYRKTIESITIEHKNELQNNINSHKEELHTLMLNHEKNIDKINKNMDSELQKYQDSFEEKLQFEKEKLQVKYERMLLDKDKTIAELQDTKSR